MAIMSAAASVLDGLRNLDCWLGNFPNNEQPARFEFLVAQAFAHILHVKLYTTDEGAPSGPHVVWRGSLGPPIQKACPRADAIAVANDFTLLVEPTLSEENQQWRQELLPCIDHYRCFLESKDVAKDSVYPAIIVKQPHDLTWRGIKGQGDIQLVLLDIQSLCSILDACRLAMTITHGSVRMALGHLARIVKDCVTVEEYMDKSHICVQEWQIKTLEQEKEAFLGIRGWRAMRQIGRLGRRTISSGEIAAALAKDPVVDQYMQAIKASPILRTEDIEESLSNHGLVVEVSATGYDQVFVPVTLSDYADRNLRLTEEVRRLNATE